MWSSISRQTTAFGHQIPGTALGVAIELSPASRESGKVLWGLLEEKSLSTTGVAGWINWAITSRAGQFLPHLPLLGKWIAARYAERYQTVTSIIRLDQGGTLTAALRAGEVLSSRYYNARVVRQWEEPIIERGTYGSFNPWWKTGLKAGGAAFLISASFQLYDDWDNPYLTPWQKVRRTVWSGGVSFVSTLAGASVGAVAGTATGVPIVGTVVGAVAGFGFGLLAELQVTPVIFEWAGDIPERHLAPLP